MWDNILFGRKYRVRDVFLHPEFDFNPVDDLEEVGPGHENYDYDFYGPSLDLFFEEHRNPSLNDIALLKLSQ